MICWVPHAAPELKIRICSKCNSSVAPSLVGTQMNHSFHSQEKDLSLRAILPRPQPSCNVHAPCDPRNCGRDRRWGGGSAALSSPFYSVGWFGKKSFFQLFPQYCECHSSLLLFILLLPLSLLLLLLLFNPIPPTLYASIQSGANGSIGDALKLD